MAASKARPTEQALSACAVGRNAAPGRMPPRPQGHAVFASTGVAQCDEGLHARITLAALVEHKNYCGIGMDI